MVASRSVHRVVNVRSSTRFSRGRASRMDLQLDVRELLVADQRQFDLGVGQEEQVLEGAVERCASRRGRPGLLDAQPRLGERGAVDPLDGDRSQPIVAAVSSKVDDAGEGGNS